MLMPVVPQLCLVQQEEEDHAYQQCGKQFLGAGLALEGLGQQVHEGGGQQGARCKTEQVLRAHAPGTAVRSRKEAQAHQARRQPHAANARGQGRDQDCYQSHGLRARTRTVRPFPSKIFAGERPVLA